ncbi:MAG: hypothetical protein GY798_34875 [Hyphomicrobiales bacterium]|nr:hypothetical protein [Hyphomicrobiales bacterium]
MGGKEAVATNGGTLGYAFEDDPDDPLLLLRPDQLLSFEWSCRFEAAPSTGPVTAFCEEAGDQSPTAEVITFEIAGDTATLIFDDGRTYALRRCE